MTDLLAELTVLEAELHHPGRTCTRERLEQLLHPAFHEVGRSGRPYSRQAVIDFLAARTAIPRVVPSGHRVQPLAPDWALLHFRSEEIADDDGTRSNAALRVSLWNRTGIGRQLYYHQGTPEAAAI